MASCTTCTNNIVQVVKAPALKHEDERLKASSLYPLKIIFFQNKINNIFQGENFEKLRLSVSFVNN